MSKTIVDMPKIAQLLDSGFQVRIFRSAMGSYTACCKKDGFKFDWPEEHLTDGGELMADDFTPEQSLTRLAYKVHGEII